MLYDMNGDTTKLPKGTKIISMKQANQLILEGDAIHCGISEITHFKIQRNTF
jgi:hypothetical protein